MKRFTLGESAFYSRKELPQSSETAARAKCCCVLGDCSALGFWVRRSTGDGERQGTSPWASCSKGEPGQRVGMANYVQVGITSPAVSAEPFATDRGVCSAQLSSALGAGTGPSDGLVLCRVSHFPFAPGAQLPAVQGAPCCCSPCCTSAHPWFLQGATRAAPARTRLRAPQASAPRAWAERR